MPSSGTTPLWINCTLRTMTARQGLMTRVASLIISSISSESIAFCTSTQVLRAENCSRMSCARRRISFFWLDLTRRLVTSIGLMRT